MNSFGLTPGATGNEGDQLVLLLCESGIELAPAFFQSVGGRLWFGAPEASLSLGSARSMLGLSRDDVLVFADVIIAAVLESVLGVAALEVEGILAETVNVGVVVVVVVVLVVSDVVEAVAVDGGLRNWDVTMNEFEELLVVVLVSVVVEIKALLLGFIVVVKSSTAGIVAGVVGVRIGVAEVEALAVCLVVLDVGIIVLANMVELVVLGLIAVVVRSLYSLVIAEDVLLELLAFALE